MYLGLAALLSASLAKAGDDTAYDNHHPSDSPWTFSVGLRAIPNTTSVQFGHLGAVSSVNTPTGSAATNNQIYDNGTIGTDAPRSGEPAASTPPNYPQTYATYDSANNQNGQYIGYQNGQTRNWSYQNQSQLINGGTAAAMSTFSTTAETGNTGNPNGSTIDGSGHDLGTGVQMSAAYQIGRAWHDRIEWGLSASVGFSRFSGSASGTVTSNLTATTVDYALNPVAGSSVTPTAPYTGPSYANYTQGNGTVITNGQETTTPVSTSSTPDTTTPTTGTGQVSGNWEISGAVVALHLGPDIKINLNDQWSLFTSAGFLGDFVAASYLENETLTGYSLGAGPANYQALSGGAATSHATSTVLKPEYGVYSEANIEYWPSERTGFYVGVVYEKLNSDFNMQLGGRTAEVQLSGTGGVQSGIIFRF